jgi:hypothetical protein
VTIAGVFGWSGETWVAVCTLVLALFTACLAGFTGWLASVSRSEVATAVHPLLVDVPGQTFMREQEIGGYAANIAGSASQRPRSWVDVAAPSVRIDDSGVTVIEFSVRNTGNGTALPRSRPRVTANTRQTVSWSTKLARAAVPLGEPARVWLELRDTTATDPNTAGGFVLSLGTIDVELDYTDLNGKQSMRSVFTLRFSRQGDDEEAVECAVERVRLYHGGERSWKRLLGLAGEAAYADVELFPASYTPM